jgi:SAM-dependent methyltransferase
MAASHAETNAPEAAFCSLTKVCAAVAKFNTLPRILDLTFCFVPAQSDFSIGRLEFFGGPMELAHGDLMQVRTLLHESDPLTVAIYLKALQEGQADVSVAAQTRQKAERLGWVYADRAALTPIGWFAADSLREYFFWRERGRKLPFADAIPEVVHEALAGRNVLEIGSGSGMNLMSLAQVSETVTGLEPVAIYRQIGAVLAEVEGLSQVVAKDGRAEALPFEAEQFDTVICVSAHQYFDMVPAFREIARVLRPGGEVVLISGTWSRYLLGSAHKVLTGLSAAKNYVVTVVNTASYMVMRRKILVRPSKWTTAYPIYPARWAMVGLLREAGLTMVGPPERRAGETLFRARKAETR